MHQSNECDHGLTNKKIQEGQIEYFATRGPFFLFLMTRIELTPICPMNHNDHSFGRI